VRRHPPPVDPADEPPARLRAFYPDEWLPLVDPDEYDPDDYRDRMNWEPVGPVRLSSADWRLNRAWRVWSRARMEWHKEHGWPGGLDYVELTQETVRMRRKSNRLV